MQYCNYTISKLNDFSRIPEISRLVKNSFTESGLIPPDYESEYLDLYPYLNKISETTVLIAESEGRIIGTNSITIDGPAGLHTDFYFKKETDIIRKTGNKILGSSWRIATAPTCRKNFRLFLDLIENTFKAGKEKNIETCLFVFAKKHENFYKRILDAETVAEKKHTDYPYNNVTFVLLKADTENTGKHLSKRFTGRRFL
ncbi:MAG: hypothetical protein GXO50_06945 [Chlorobi bacterium]|nr:hypothetical protein [Chlorobiota bacterium]